MPRLVSPVFVGREPELALRSGLLRQLAAGRSSVVVVGGEAGIGKTRLVTEFGQAAGQAGVRVLTGGCLELGAQGLPFAPLAGALRMLIREIGEQGFADLVGDRDEFTVLLPELGPPPARPRGGQGRLFGLTLRVFERLAAQRPLLFLVEDLHWADRSTLDLVAFLVRSLRHAPVAFMITFRSDELAGQANLPTFLAELDRLDHVTRVELPRLSRRAVRRQVHALLEVPPAPSLLRWVYERSDGNPFFVEELVGCAVGEPGSVGTEVPLSTTLREMLLARVRRLPEPARAVLRLASVAGPEVSHALLAGLAEMDDEAFIEAVRAARDGHVLVSDPHEPGYAFRHALVREVVYADLLPAERTRLHARLAQAIGQRPGLVRAGRASADIARHWYAAGRHVEALTSAVEAAEEAGRQYAYAEQHHLLERAIDLRRRLDAPAPAPAPDVRLDRLYEAASAAAFEAGELDRSLHLVDAALSLADGRPEPDRVVPLLRRRARLLRLLGRDGSVSAVRQAVALAPAPSSTRAAVLADLAFALQIALVPGGQPDLREARQRCEEALELARRCEDRATEAWAWIVLGSILVNLDDVEAGVEQARRGIEAARAIRDDQLYARAAIVLSDALEVAGRYREAAEVGRAAVRHLEQVGLFPMWGAAVVGNLGDALLRLGRWDEADEITAAALDRDPPGVYATHLHQLRGDLAAARGDLSTAAAHRDAFHDLLAGEHPVVHEQLSLARLTAEILLWKGRPEEAGERIAVALRGGLRPGAGQRVWPVLSLGARAVADAAERRRDRRGRAVGREVGELADLIGGTALGLPRTTARARLHAALVDAELHRYAGRRTLTAWQVALEAAEQVDDPYAVSYALMRTAEGLVLARTPEKAVETLRRAAELVDRLGARPLGRCIEKTARQVRGRTPARRRRPEHAFHFTDREQEVAALVGRGMTNQEVAERLFVSAKTVEYHLGKIYTKLGVTSRRELRTYIQG